MSIHGAEKRNENDFTQEFCQIFHGFQRNDLSSDSVVPAKYWKLLQIILLLGFPPALKADTHLYVILKFDGIFYFFVAQPVFFYSCF